MFIYFIYISFYNLNIAFQPNTSKNIKVARALILEKYDDCEHFWYELTISDDRMVLTRDFNRSRKKLYLTVLSFGITLIKIRGRDWSARSSDLNPFSI